MVLLQWRQKTAVGPIERIKLLRQNQDEILKQKSISQSYTGVTDCTLQAFNDEGTLSFWQGDLANRTR